MEETAANTAPTIIPTLRRGWLGGSDGEKIDTTLEAAPSIQVHWLTEKFWRS